MRGSHFPAAVLPNGDGGGKPRSADEQRPCPEDGVPPLDAVEILAWLTDDLRSTLASLHQAPASLAAAVAQLLPFGSRAALIELGLAERQTGDSTAPAAVLELTPLAYEVMQAAALADETDSAGVEEWIRQAERAATFQD